MAGPNNPGYVYSQISASTAVKSSTGIIGGIFVSAASNTPTITVYDNTAGSGTKIIDTFTPTAGTYYNIPAAYSIGCYVAIGGTVSCTVFYV
jgi:hypothetical protein